MSRFPYRQPASRPRAALQWAVLAGAAAAATVLAWMLLAPPVDSALPAVPAPIPLRAAPLALAPDEAQAAGMLAPAAAVAAVPAAVCPLQALQLALGGNGPQTVCVDATRVLQNGSVRAYQVGAGGAQGWLLRVDTAAGAVLKVSLQARDGQAFSCSASRCAAVALQTPLAGGVRSVELRALRLAPEGAAAANAGDAVVDARLQVPADEQVPGLACGSPSITLRAGDGSSRRFCGQGGAGFDVADDGTHNYRFQDHEGRTLSVALNGEQQVTGISLGPNGCWGAACVGARSTGAAPSQPLGERSFFFGRTPLYEGGRSPSAGRPRQPAVVLDGSLVMPAQE